MGKALYRPILGDILLDSFNPIPAIVFYLLYVVGIVIFAVAPALRTGDWTAAIVDGALFGLFAYATYDLSNLATLKGWSMTITLVDLCWGTTVTAASATLGYKITEAFSGS